MAELPPVFLYVIFALCGLVVGSLAGALSYRLPRKQPVVFDRSRCPACRHELGPRDLIPVFSWLLAKGRCRYCQAPVSTRYLWIELATAALFLVALAVAPNLGGAVCLAYLGAGLAVLTVSDLESRILPDLIQIGLALLALGWHWTTGGDWADMLLGGALGLGLGALLRSLYFKLKHRHGLGMGDVKFLGVAGLWLGVQGFPFFLLGAGLLGVVFGLAWRLLTRNKVFPFGPALCVSLFVTLILLPVMR